MPEDPASKSESKSPDRSEQFAAWIVKAMMAGGGVGTFWSLFVSSDLPKAAVSAAVGLGAGYVLTLMKPVDAAIKEKLEKGGKVLVRQTVETFTQVEKQYLEALKVECYKIDVEGYDLGVKLALEDIYVPLRIQAPIAQRSLQGGLEIWHFLPKRGERVRSYPNRRIVVLAAPGYGKTTLIRYLTLMYAHQAPQTQQTLTFLPILLRLREIYTLIPEASRLALPELCAKYFGDKSEFRTLKLSRDWFDERLKKTALVMLDGLDEVPKSQRPKIRKWVDDEMRAYPAAQFILTSRPGGFELQPDEPSVPVDVDLRLEVLNFNPSQIRSFIDKWYLAIERWNWQVVQLGNRSALDRQQLDQLAVTTKIEQEATEAANQLSQQIFASPALTDLAKNPLLVTMIAATHNVQQADLPKQRVELYSKILDVLLGSRPSVKKTNLTLGITQNKAVLQLLAWELVRAQKTQFTLKEGTRWIQEKLARCHRSFTSEQFWQEMKQTAGLLIEKEQGRYEFAHQTFQEYFAAVHAREEGLEAVILENLSNDRWEEVICFYAALGNATPLIEAGLERLEAVPELDKPLMALLFRCLNEGRELDQQARNRCEQWLLHDSLEKLQGVFAPFSLEQRYRDRLVVLDDQNVIASEVATAGDYQLFLQAQAEGQFHSQASGLLQSLDETQPVVGISWQDARWFCAWLSAQATLQSEDIVYDYRLPSETELQRVNDRQSFTQKESDQRDRTLRVVRERLPERYKSLHSYLASGRWQEADKETYQVMLEVVGRTERGFLDKEDLQKFPCEDLRILDQLWVKFSGGHFGFSVQKQIYVECGNPLDGKYHEGKWEAFCDRVGWRREGDRVSYTDVIFDTTSPLAHLPCRVFLGVGVGGWVCVVGGGGGGCGSLLSRRDL